VKNPLVGGGFGTLGSPISHRGDRGAVCPLEPESGDGNPGWATGFYRDEGWGREGYPYSYRRKKRKK
jgi:hypothetical protein